MLSALLFWVNVLSRSAHRGEGEGSNDTPAHLTHFFLSTKNPKMTISKMEISRVSTPGNDGGVCRDGI